MWSILLELRVWPRRPIYPTEKYFKYKKIWQNHTNQTKGQIGNHIYSFYGRQNINHHLNKAFTNQSSKDEQLNRKVNKRYNNSQKNKYRKPVLPFLMTSWGWTVSCVSVWPILKWKRTLNSSGRVRGALHILYIKNRRSIVFLNSRFLLTRI